MRKIIRPAFLFVCTGNICRSPMAEGMLRARLIEAGRDNIVVDSAGIHALVGDAPDPLAIEVAREYGAEIAPLRGRAFEPNDFEQFNHIIAMDLGHLDFLSSTRPEGNDAQVRLLLDDVGDFKRIEIADPYKQHRDAFEFSARLIDVGTKRLIEDVFG